MKRSFLILRYYNKGEGGEFSLPAEKNKMYVFPSWLKHSVTPNQSEEERISISFNLLCHIFGFFNIWAPWSSR